MLVKNLIVNVFKTLFFFDLTLILTSLIPAIAFKKEQLLILSSNLTNFLIVLVLSFFFFRFVEKKQLKSNEKNKKFSGSIFGLLSGLVIPIIYTVILFILKSFKYVGFNKSENILFFILSLFLNSLFVELLLRGYLFTLYKKHYGFILATVFSTLLFVSMNHEILKMNKIYMWTMILFNVYLCFVRDKFKTIFSSIFANFSFSFASVMLLGYKVSSMEYPKLLNLKLEGKEKYIGGEFLIMGSKITLIAFSAIIITWFIFKYKVWQYFTKQKIKFYIYSIKKEFIDFIDDIKNTKYRIKRSFGKIKLLFSRRK